MTDDNQDDAEHADAAVAKSVAVSPIGDDAASPQSAEEQHDQEDNQDDSQKRHGALLQREKLEKVGTLAPARFAWRVTESAARHATDVAIVARHGQSSLI